jgi:hypothetical protein
MLVSYPAAHQSSPATLWIIPMQVKQLRHSRALLRSRLKIRVMDEFRFSFAG